MSLLYSGYVNSLDCEGCSTLPLCSQFKLADTTCGGRFQPDGLQLSFVDRSLRLLQFRIAPNISSYDLGGTSNHDGFLVQGVCEGAKLIDPQQLINAENSISCRPQRQSMNVITLNCKVEVSLNPEEYGIYLIDCPQPNCTSSIFIVSKSTSLILTLHRNLCAIIDSILSSIIIK